LRYHCGHSDVDGTTVVERQNAATAGIVVVVVDVPSNYDEGGQNQSVDRDDRCNDNHSNTIADPRSDNNSGIGKKMLCSHKNTVSITCNLFQLSVTVSLSLSLVQRNQFI
jgi:hypothetical protein